MKKTTKADSTIFADPIFHDTIPRRTKLALATFYKKNFPIYVEYVVLFIEYAQLLSQILLQTNSLYYTQDLNSDSSLSLISFFLKFINPGYFLDFEGYHRLSWGIAIAALCYIVLRIALVIYVMWIIFRKNEFPQHLTATIWEWFSKLHVPVIYFMLISIFSKIIEIAEDGIGVLPTLGITLCGIFIFLETAMTFSLTVRYNYLLPQKNFTASKNKTSEIIVICQKLLLIILQPLLPLNSRSSLVVTATISFLSSNIMNYVFFTTLPNFNTKALIFKQHMITLVTSLSLIFFIRSIIVSIDGLRFGIDSALIIWIFLVPLLLKAFSTQLKHKLFKIMTHIPNSNSLDALIHKFVLVKDLIVQKRLFDNENITIDRAYFFHKTVDLSLTSLFHLDNEFAPVQSYTIQTKKQAHKVFLAYLEGLQVQFPKNDYLKLYLAYFYGKKLKMYGVAIRHLTYLESKGRFQATLSASLLKREIQRKMTIDQARKSNEINLITYLKNVIRVSKVKDKMLKQTELQIKLCNEYKKDVPDMAKILEFSQEIDQQRLIVDRKLKATIETAPDYYLEPYIIAQYYYGMVNHSIFDHIRFRKTLANKGHKYEKKFKSNQLEEENIFDASNVFFVISGQKENAGAIVYCSKSVEDALGWNPKHILETNIMTLAPTSLQSFYMDNIKSYIEESDRRAKESVIRTFMLNKAGFMCQVDISLAIHPYMQEGFYLDVLVRPVPLTVDYLILTDDGRINSFTKKVGAKLGLLDHKSGSKGDIYAKSICEDLDRANIAFNVLTNHTAAEAKADDVSRYSQRSSNFELTNNPSSASAGKSKSRMSHFNFMKRRGTVNTKENNLVETMKLFNAFSSEGKVVKLHPLKHSHETDTSHFYPYHCQIENRIYGQSQIRLCALIETNNYDVALNEQKTEELGSAHKILPKLRNVYAKSESSSSNDDSDTDSKDEKIENPKNEILPSFHTEDEKQNGWVNFERLSITKSQLESPAISPVISVGVGNTTKVFTFDRTRDRLPSTRRTLLGDQLLSSSRVELAKENLQKRPSKIIKPQKVKPETKTTDKKQFEDLLDIQRSMGSQKSNFSTRGRIFKACEKALETRYYPKRFDALYIGIAALLFVAFVSQIALRFVADERFDTLIGRRDILRNAQIRNYMLIRTQELVRSLWTAGTINGSDVFTDPQDIADAGEIGNWTVDTLQLSQDIVSDLDSLVNANQQLLLATNSLDEEDRDRLFSPNVRVFDTYFDEPVQTFINSTNFQATDLVVANLYKGLLQARTNVSLSVPQFKFICRNSLNDFLVTSESTVDVFLDALNQMELQDKNIHSAMFALGIVMIAIGFAIVSTTLVLKFKKEKFCLGSFSRLEVVEVEKVLKRLVDFKKIMNEELYYKKRERALDGSVIFDGLLRTREDLQSSVKKHLREVNNNGIMRKYYLYGIKILLLMGILVGAYSIKYVLALNSVDFTYLKLRQLEYSDAIRGRIYLSYTILSELLAENNTVLIRNEKTSVQLTKSIADINGIRTNISDGTFADSGSKYDPVIEGLIFHDACSYLTGNDANACSQIQMASNNLNFLSLLSDLEYFTTDFQSSYNISAKRSLQLRKLSRDADTKLDPRVQTLTQLNKLLSDRLDQVFENEVNSARNSNDVKTTLMVLALAIVGVGTWYLILRKIRESENDFKRLLKVFPADIILSNFLLKDYLKKTSKDAFNSVVNEI